MPAKTRKEQSAQPAALQGLAALCESLAKDNPSFKLALSAEKEAEEFCSKARKDLQEKRKSLNIDQKEMGRRLNLSQSAISKIENGHGDIGMKTLHRYARALGLQPVLGYVPTIETMKATKTAAPSGILEPTIAAVELGSAVAAAVLTAAFDIQVNAQNTLLQQMHDTITKLSTNKEKNEESR